MSKGENVPVVTADDLLTMPDGDDYELIEGRLVERMMGSRASYFGGNAFCLIAEYCDDHRLGWTFPARCGYQCFPEDPNCVRRPNASFMRFGKLPGEILPEGHCRIAPDLVVEVSSPNTLDYETGRKVEQYLRAGVRLVWIVNPEIRTVLVYRADGSIQGFRERNELDGEDVLPGFRGKVSALFTTPADW